MMNFSKKQRVIVGGFLAQLASLTIQKMSSKDVVILLSNHAIHCHKTPMWRSYPANAIQNTTPCRATTRIFVWIW
jgi:hypothetical protein